MNETSGKPYEEELCEGTGPQGIIYIGDSIGAHFHVPPEWITAEQITMVNFRSNSVCVSMIIFSDNNFVYFFTYRYYIVIKYFYCQIWLFMIMKIYIIEHFVKVLENLFPIIYIDFDRRTYKTSIRCLEAHTIWI